MPFEEFKSVARWHDQHQNSVGFRVSLTQEAAELTQLHTLSCKGQVRPQESICYPYKSFGMPKQPGCGQEGCACLLSGGNWRAMVCCGMRQRLCPIPPGEQVPRCSTRAFAKSRRKSPTCPRLLSLQGLERSWQKHRSKWHQEANKWYFVSGCTASGAKAHFFPPDTMVLHTNINFYSNSPVISLQNELLLK